MYVYDNINLKNENTLYCINYDIIKRIINVNGIFSLILSEKKNVIVKDPKCLKHSSNGKTTMPTQFFIY